MISLFMTVGIIAGILAIAFIILKLVINTEEEVLYRGTDHERVQKPNKVLVSLTNKMYPIIAGSVALVLVTLANSMYYAERGTYYEIIYPNGAKTAEFKEGYHMIIPGTKVNPWTANIDVKCGDISKMSKDVEGKMNPVVVTFIDQVTADVHSAFRFSLPADEESFLALALKYRSIENLVENTTIPTIAEQAKLTSKMFTAQDYISGSSQAFRQTFEEQLKNGTYIVEKVIIRDTLWEESSSIQQKGDRKIKNINIKYDVQKVIDPVTKLPKRIPNEISSSGIIVSQVIVNGVDVDEAYKQRLKDQKAESAKRQLEQQKIETAKIEKVRIQVEGERDKEKERQQKEK